MGTAAPPAYTNKHVYMSEYVHMDIMIGLVAYIIPVYCTRGRRTFPPRSADPGAARPPFLALAPIIYSVLVS